MNTNKQPNFWIDLKHHPDGSTVVAIECDDKELTFDGHYVCLFPPKQDETDLVDIINRVDKILNLLRGLHDRTMLQRYSMSVESFNGSDYVSSEESEDGAWVKFEDLT
jgi:hypothetical protein